MKKISALVLSLVLCLGIMGSPAMAAPEDESIPTTKQALYESYLSVIEEKSAVCGVGCIPVSFEEFSMKSLEDVQQFAALYDAINVWQENMGPLSDDFSAIHPIENEITPRLTVLHKRTATTGSISFNVDVIGTFSTKLNSGLGVQVFSSGSIRISLKHPNTFTTTANRNGISSSDPQVYNVSMQGNLKYDGQTFTGVTVTDTFYCSDTGVVS